ncbi:MAG: hypothetical protein ACRDOI_38820 [Trebonia sp.]
MANAKAQHELVGVLINKYPRLAVRLAEVSGQSCPEYDRVTAGPNTHQVRKAGKRGQVMSDATVHLMRDEEKCHFFQVEMQRDYSWSKLATLRAYHGSEVRNAECGGHLFVLSPRTTVADGFVRAEKDAAARLAFSASYLTGRDLAPLAVAGRPFEERALAAAVTDLSKGITDQVIPVLLEMREHDDTVADLFLTAILEECPDEGELEDKLSDLAMQRLESLPSFQRWAARTSKRIKAEVEAEVEARVYARYEAQASQERVRAAEEAAAERVRAAEEAAAERAREVVRGLQTFFTAKGDVSSLSALETMNACTDVTTARFWLNRAYAGESSAEIFSDGNDPK